MFAEVLKNLRNEKNLSQEELAKIIGISKSTIGMYEQGQRMPKADVTLRKLAEFFDVSIDYLVGLSPINKQKNEPVKTNVIYSNVNSDVNQSKLSAEVITLFGTRLKELRIKKGYSMDKLIELYNARYDAKMNKSTLSRYENGLQDPIYTVVVNLAHFFNVSVDYISGTEKEPTTTEKSNAIFIDNNCIYMIPIYESVSAGFGAYASDYITDYMPCYINNKAEADATLCIVVTGDSMYPKIENGDTIQVHKQSSVDSGSIAVVLIDKTEALVKKVVYGDDWIELHSINPMYPVLRFDGKDVLRIEVLGLVKKIIKNV